MQHELPVAAIQLNANHTRQENLVQAERLVRQAAAQGAKLVVLPEMCNGYGHLGAIAEQAEPIPGESSELFRHLAQELNIWLLAGSICQQSENACYNTSLLFNSQGQEAMRYQKMHLFQVELPNKPAIREADFIQGGKEIGICETSLGNLGVAICYDLRFPELFRKLSEQGMEILLFPSAFTQFTGRDHWEILLRARAIENQCFVIAANQCGRHDDQSAPSYGHSLILDPWGRILAEATEPEQIIYATLKSDTLKVVKECLPALRHRVL
jgi:deaminated glutathione amidase